jgi:hypothetical protein
MSRVVLATLFVCSIAHAERPLRSDAAEAVAIARSCVRRAGAQPERARDFLVRVRRAAWWPELRLGAERDFGTREVIDPTDHTRYGAYAVDEVRIEARATWHLDRLVFDPEELRASRESVRLAELRQELALTAVRLYFERRRLELEDETGPEPTARDAALRAARIAELEAALEALCGTKEAPRRAR